MASKTRSKKPNRTKTLQRQLERKKQTIKNIRERKREERHYKNISRANGLILNNLERIIEGDFD